MESKTCNTCSETKTLNLFPKTGKWYRNKCKKCCSDARKGYRQHISERNKEYQKQYRKKNKEELKEKDKVRNEVRKNERKEQGKKYYQENKERIVKRNYKYEKQRKEIDPEYKLLKNLRKRLRDCLLQKTDKENSKELIGCSPSYFKKWLEYQFDPYMSWKNYGIYWEMDHVKPCSSFNLLVKEQRLECFNWKNTRPLYVSENASKSDIFTEKTLFLHQIIVKSFQIKEMDNPQRSYS